MYMYIENTRISGMENKNSLWSTADTEWRSKGGE